MSTRGPLNGIRVLEFGHHIAGPFCTQILADQGADVIKVEAPGGGPHRHSDPVKHQGGYFPMLNRNKRSIEVDLKTTAGGAIVRALVDTADVVVTNFGNTVPTKLGIDYDQLNEINPRLIYVHVTGFGREGVYADRPAYDGIVQAMSGLMHMTGEPERPPVLAGFFVADHVSGLYAALAVLLGLQERAATGRGCFIDLAMLDAMMSLAGSLPGEVVDFGRHPHRTGGKVPRSYAGTHPTSDGWVYLAPLGPRMWEHLADVMQEPILRDFCSTNADAEDRRIAHRVELDARIDTWTSQRTTQDVEQTMLAHGIPCSSIYSIERVVKDENVAGRRLLRTVTLPGGFKRTVPASPLPCDDATYAASPPLVGEHTDEILAELGFVTAEASSPSLAHEH